MTRKIVMGTLAAALMQATTGPVRAQGAAAPAKNHESRIQANGINLAYRSYGSADRETILLICA